MILIIFFVKDLNFYSDCKIKMSIAQEKWKKINVTGNQNAKQLESILSGYWLLAESYELKSLWLYQITVSIA